MGRKRQRWRQAARSGCHGALSLPGPVPDAAWRPVSCRSGSTSPWTTAAASSRTWTEPWVSSPHRERVERRGGSRQGLSPRGREGGFLSGGCAGGSLASSPGPPTPPGVLGQSCMSLRAERGGSRDQLTKFTHHRGRKAASSLVVPTCPGGQELAQRASPPSPALHLPAEGSLAWGQGLTWQGVGK